MQRISNLPKKYPFFLFGPRQTGKTTLIRTILSPEDWSIDLLNEDTYLDYKKDPSKFRRQFERQLKKDGSPPQRVFLDEIQRVPELLNEIHSLIETYPSCQFIMTGSSARKLRHGAANLLAGRAFTRNLFPITYEEAGEVFELEDVLKYGSLPRIFSLEVLEKIDFLKTYAMTYLKEEIQAEALVRNLGGFTRFLEVAAAQCGEVVNMASIGRDSAVSTRTVRSYYEILEDTLIGFRLESWRKSLRKRLLGHPKFYFFDTGVTNAINHRLSGELNPKQKGRLFEQWVILETQRLLDYQRSEARMYYWRTNHGAEVDLLIEKHGEVIAGIEIKSSPQIAGRDLTGLRSFKEDYPNAKFIIVSLMPRAFDLDFVEILPYQDYLKWLEEIC